MGVIIPQVLTEDRVSGAQIVDGSLRFDSSKSHYLSRTPGSVGNRKTWTLSWWQKLCSAPASDPTLFASGSSTSDMTIIRLETSSSRGRFQFANNTGGSSTCALITTQVLNDFSAWQHIIVSIDTTQSTSTNRVKIYINGLQVTAFDTATYPTQNSDLNFNSNVIHNINRESARSNYYQNLYASNIYLIDGQALGPEYFGYTDPLTNTWRPKKYTGNFNYSAPTGTLTSTQTALPTYSNQGGGSENSSYPVSNGFDGSASTYCDMTYLNGQWSKLTFGQAITNVTNITIGYDGEGDIGYNGSVTNTTVGYTGSRQTITLYSGSAITLTDLYFVTQAGNGVCRLYDVTINGVEQTFVAGTGTNSFYLPFDGNSPIGQDQSGRGNNWTPVNFGGSNTLEKATGALPILNTDGGGKVARVGVRTDSNASSLVLALPLVGVSSDFSNAINSGTSNKAVTVVGGATASSAQSNFYGGSFYFDGDGDALTVSSVGSLNADFTIEAWIWCEDTSTSRTIFGPWVSPSVLNLRVNSSTAYLLEVSGVSLSPAFGGISKWHHVALCREGSTLRMYENGIERASTTFSGTLDLSTNDLRIGQEKSSSSTADIWKGYISDVRVYNGVAKYTQNFIPASTDPDILPDTPSGVAYSSNVTAITDGAVAFDGSGDYLSFATNSDFGLASGDDFTIECFTYAKSYDNSTSYSEIIRQGTSNAASSGIYFNINSTGTLSFRMSGTTKTTTGTVIIGGWNHVSVCRSSGTVYMSINGVVENFGSVTNSSPTGDFRIGANFEANAFYKGQLSNVRFVKGTALYTSNFTPPTAPLTSVENTKLLCCKSNSSATAFDVSPGTITANGNAAATNFNPFTANINAVRGQESGYATLNPLDNAGTLSNGNLNFSNGASNASVRSTFALLNSGKFYAEAVTGSLSSASSAVSFGFATSTLSLTASPLNTGNYTIYSDNIGRLIVNGTAISTSLGTFSAGTLLQIAYDGSTGKGWLGKENIWYDSSGGTSGNPSLGLNPTFTTTSTLFLYSLCVSNSVAANFGQKPFKFPPPAGFQPLALANTPRPTIVRPDQYVGVTTYSGNGSTQTISGLGFSPDFVWIKVRNGSVDHVLYDQVRGTQKYLSSNTTGQEGDQTGTPNVGLYAFNSNGFSVGDISGGSYGVNGSSGRYVAWAWKAGGNSNTFNIDDVGYASASAAGLTAGTITPTGASVNTTSGFSIIGYTGTDNTSDTFSHGLTKKPDFAIFKNRSQAGDDWIVYHSSQGATKRGKLNLTNAFDAQTSQFNDTEPTSSVFTIGTFDNINKLNSTYIAYLWAEIPGFSKFGSYTGNGNSAGPYVHLGFKPAVVIIKCIATDATYQAYYSWSIWDNKRPTYNPCVDPLFANRSTPEGYRGDGSTNSPGALKIDFLSNGFNIISTWPSELDDQYTYIYAAWAEAPTFNLYGAQSNAR